MCQKEAHATHHSKGLACTPVVSRSLEHNVGDSTFWLISTPFLRENTLGASGAFHISSPSINLTRGLAARRLFEVPPCREGTIHLQTSMPSPGLKPRSNGTGVRVTNRYTGWAADERLNYRTKTELFQLCYPF
ncbi:hypothetical protein TNCV_4226661 [Trichonephila clavipes]|nr:hypothetical protein TNCV_4226661 [Trichonephila clavipes]